MKRFLQANSGASFKFLVSLDINFPEDMFCFCFQSPSLKLQALEADSGPLEAPLDPQAQDNLPAQSQPLSAEERSLYLTHKLILQPPLAEDQDMVDPSQPGKKVVMF